MKTIDLKRANVLTTQNTGFSSFQDMLEAKSSYRPSMNMREWRMRELADYYDQAMEERGDDRRTYRYGIK